MNNKKDKITVKEINEAYDKLASEIYKCLNNSINSDDPTIVYEMSQEDIDEGNHEYYIDAYNNHGSTHEMSVERVQKNGEIYGYMADLGTYWTVWVSDIFNIQDKLQILNILNNETN